LHKMSTAQKAKMLGDRRAGDGEFLGNATCRLAAAPKQVEHRTPRRVGESAKRGF